MPMYTYKCPCGATCVEPRPVERANEPAPCVECGRNMEHDMLADIRTQSMQTERDTNGAAIARHVRQVRSGRQVESRCLSRSLARVPNIPKVKGPDGCTYAVFRNRKHRAQVLQKIGIQSD